MLPHIRDHFGNSEMAAKILASSLVEVVAAVIERPDGAFLLAERPAGKVYAGYWEFPGGKVEPGEPLADRTRHCPAHAAIDLVEDHCRCATALGQADLQREDEPR